MGMGNEMAQEAMIDAMVEEDREEEEERNRIFDAIGAMIRQARTFEELKDALIILLNLIKERR
jgi:hypothetical protein